MCALPQVQVGSNVLFKGFSAGTRGVWMEEGGGEGERLPSFTVSHWGGKDERKTDGEGRGEREEGERRQRQKSGNWGWRIRKCEEEKVRSWRNSKTVTGRVRRGAGRSESWARLSTLGSFFPNLSKMWVREANVSNSWHFPYLEASSQHCM